MEETQPAWFKSSYSGAPNNECVECARNIAGRILVRDTKQPDEAVLSFTPKTWSRFAHTVQEEGTGWA